MKDHGDGWDDLVARWEVENVADAELRAAARALAEVPDAVAEPIPAAAQSAFVAGTLASVPPSAGTRRTSRVGQRLTRNVAGLAVLTAVTTLVVLWGGRDSFATLDYRTAIMILSRDDQPSRQYQSAAVIVYRQVQRAVGALRDIARRDVDSAAANEAREALRLLLAAVDGAMPPSLGSVGDARIDLDAAMRRSSSPTSTPAQLGAVAELAAFAMVGVRAVVGMPGVDEQVRAAQASCRQRLRIELLR
ncbi:MAG: hypothetical protein IPK26_20670 [Planctomycetes bacterium]|nr:hypothetical protein [Planctomycetota bacterium]